MSTLQHLCKINFVEYSIYNVNHFRMSTLQRVYFPPSRVQCPDRVPKITLSIRMLFTLIIFGYNFPLPFFLLIMHHIRKWPWKMYTYTTLGHVSSLSPPIRNIESPTFISARRRPSIVKQFQIVKPKMGPTRLLLS